MRRRGQFINGPAVQTTHQHEAFTPTAHAMSPDEIRLDQMKFGREMVARERAATVKIPNPWE
jgi:hypothetical protein